MFSIFNKKKSNVTDLNWLGVDIHSHLLPGIDDGAKDLAESISYIKSLHSLGLNKLICTPHIFTGVYPNTSDTIFPVLENVKQTLRAEGVHIDVLAAAEYMVDDTFVVGSGHLCLENNYILIEMSYLNETPNIEQVIFDLQIKGYIIVLAHPERYNFYHNDQKRYHRFKDMGCLLQLNLLSVTGYYGKNVERQASYLLKNGLYDLAGTDLHNDKHLKALTFAVKNGTLFERIGQYPFMNLQLFGSV